MTVFIRGALLAAALTACSSSQLTHANPTGGGQVSDAEVIARFTNAIWPAVEGYRYVGQGSEASKRFWSVTEADSAHAVHDAGIDLGVVMGADRVAVSFPDGPLRLANTAVTAISATDATVVACYTYASVPRNDPTDSGVPKASEATFILHKTDVWYLHAITNDHVVPDCAGSSTS